jgi:hypothetical protein
MLRSSWAARLADKRLGAPPAMSSRSTAWSRLVAWVRNATRPSWRSINRRITAVWSSPRTVRNSQCRSPAMAVDSASLLSFLPALVEPSNRTRADKVGGTSTTCSPAPTSCWASSLPNPPADSLAQVRSQPNGAAQATSRSVWHRSATT